MKCTMVLTLLSITASLHAAPQEKPNVILIITDDQGYDDIGAHGNPLIQTPNMDQLHAESVRFTNFHVDPTCSPTRGALMSGKYSHRGKVWHTIAGGNHLRANETTMADDQGLGRLRKTLREEGLAENTILIFMTDNGGTAGVQVFNAGMRGKKGSPFEGGHRTPFFVHWKKGKLRHGRDVADLTAHFDVLPTLIDLLDLKPPAQADFDGRSFKEQLYRPEKLLPERTLCVEVQRTFEPRKQREATAMTRRWRLVNGNELYDIQADPGQKRNVLADHSEVAAILNRDFDTYWQHVSPGDRDRVVFVIGHEKDPETYLQSMDWYAETVPWNHAATSRGVPLSGSWHVEAAKAGTYRFEIRRWPKEVDAPITGIPKIAKTIDAWDSSGGKATLIYSQNNLAPFKAMQVAAVRLEVGDKQWVKPVDGQETHVTFDISLNEKEYEVTAELIDSDDEVRAGAYYVYCRRLD